MFDAADAGRGAGVAEGVGAKMTVGPGDVGEARLRWARHERGGQLQKIECRPGRRKVKEHQSNIGGKAFTLCYYELFYPRSSVWSFLPMDEYSDGGISEFRL